MAGCGSGGADGLTIGEMEWCVVRKWLFVFRMLALTCWVGMAHAQQIDPHSVYEKNCSGCHAPHAGEFVSQSTKMTSGTLVGKESGKPVSDYLAAGHGGLSVVEAEVLMEHMFGIWKSGRVFQQKCKICHTNAKELARSTLILRDDMLLGRYSDRNIAQFLTNHGRIDPDEVQRMVEVLKRQLETIAPPGTE